MAQILIVDDDLLTRDLLEGIVTNCGYAALTAESAFAASKVINAQDVDLILLDLFMPGLRGTEFLKAIRRRGLKTPVLVISARVGEETARELIGSDISGIVLKPFEADRVVAEIRKALGEEA